MVGPNLESLLVGVQYRVGLYLLLPIAIAMCFSGLCVIGHKCLELGEGTLAMGTSAILGGVVNLVLNVLLVPKYGYIACGYVTAFSYGLYTAFIWRQSRRFVPWKVHFGSLLPAVAVAGIATACADIVVSAFVQPAMLHVVFGAGLYLMLFALMTLVVYRRHAGSSASRVIDHAHRMLRHQVLPVADEPVPQPAGDVGGAG